MLDFGFLLRLAPLLPRDRMSVAADDETAHDAAVLMFEA